MTTMPNSSRYLPKDGGSPELGCRSCPLGQQLQSAEMRAGMASAAARALEADLPAESPNAEDKHYMNEPRRQAMQELTDSQTNLEQVQARTRRAFATCVGPRVLYTVVNNLQFSTTICTSPEAYVDGKATADLHMSALYMPDDQGDAATPLGGSDA